MRRQLMPAPQQQAISRRRRRRRCRARSRHRRWLHRCSIAQRARDGDGLGRVSKLWCCERSWVVHCRGAETNGSMIARRGRDATLVEGISVKFKARDGGLHVLRVGDERPRMAFFLPRSSGQGGCDRLIFMLLRERHALNCRRAPVAVPMVKSKWLSRPFWGREGPESGALHRGPPWVLLRSLLVTETVQHNALAT